MLLHVLDYSTCNSRSSSCPQLTPSWEVIVIIFVLSTFFSLSIKHSPRRQGKIIFFRFLVNNRTSQMITHPVSPFMSGHKNSADWLNKNWTAAKQGRNWSRLDAFTKQVHMVIFSCCKDKRENKRKTLCKNIHMHLNTESVYLLHWNH